MRHACRGGIHAARLCDGIHAARRKGQSRIVASFVVALALGPVTLLQAQSRTDAAPVAQTTTGSEARQRAIETAVLSQRISLHVTRVTISDALASIAARSGVRLQYNEDALPADRLVSVDADSMTLGDALTKVLQGTGLAIVVPEVGRIRLRPTPDQHDGTNVNVLQAQGTAIVTGFVRDSVTGASIPQVVIHVEGTTLETTSGADGRFRIANLAAGDYRLIARRVGYLSRTRAVTLVDGQAATVNFVLNPPATKLDEVVTTALGDQRRYTVGNVISTINVDSLAPTAPVTSVTDILSARAPGVLVEENGGLVGSGETIRIRGVSSLLLQSDPILIVDGVRQDNAPGGDMMTQYYSSGPGTYIYNGSHWTPSRINDLNFDDIETVDVLKGPAATTEYGTDAANGVIIITTKHGHAGGAVWHADGEQTTTGTPSAFPATYYSYGHVTDGTGNEAAGAGCTLEAFGGGLYAQYGPGYNMGATRGTCIADSTVEFNPLNDPATTVIGTGHRQKYDVSVSGGTEAVRYFLAGGMSDETGVVRLPPVFQSLASALGLDVPKAAFKSNTEQQQSGRLNAQIKLNDQTDISANLNYFSTTAQTPEAGSLVNDAQSSLAIDNAANVYGYGGNSAIYGGTPSTSQNPLSALSDIGIDNNTALTAGLSANWRPMSWLVGHATFGIDHGVGLDQSTEYPIGNNSYDYTGPPSLVIHNSVSNVYTLDLRVVATANVTRVLRAVTSAGLQMADSRSDGQAGYVQNITLDNLSLNGYPNPTVEEFQDRSATLGAYGEEQLSIAERLFLTGAVRADGASGFGSNYVVAAYPKASVSWLLLPQGSTTLRLRGALGESGVQPENGAALQLYSAGLAYSGGQVVSSNYMEWPGNPNLRPERSTEYEGGFDFGAWGNRVSLEFTAYSKVTHDALLNLSLNSGDLCCYAYQENLGEVENGGAEATATIGILQSRLLTWDVSINGSVNHNKFVAVEHNLAISAGYYNNTGSQQFRVGYPLYGFWGYHSTYADLNHDGLIEGNEVSTADSARYVGPGAPTREWSLSTHIGLWHEALTVSGLFDYRGGYYILNYVAGQMDENGSSPETNFPTAPQWLQARAVAPPGGTCCESLEGSYEEGSFIRFRELSLTYAIPRTVARRLRVVEALSITGAVRNLALWTRYTGPDPEVSNGAAFSDQNGSINGTAGEFVNNDIRVDAGEVPLLRDWVLRLNVGLK